MTTENKTTDDKPGGFTFDSIASVHDDIIERSPEVSEAAVAAHEQEQQATIEQTQATATARGGQTDSAGTVFDPELHATNAEGEPSLTATGKFRKKRGASKVAKQTTVAADAQRKAEARASGVLAANLMTHTATMLLGEEWITRKVGEYDEQAHLDKAFGDYFEAKEIQDFPPGVALTIACMSYAAPRLISGKETKSKMQRVKLWLVEKGAKLKRKRSKDNAAQPDSGDNGERKDDARETPMRPE